MKIIGFDQATHISGYAVFDNGKCVRTGVLETDKKNCAFDRMIVMRNKIIEIIKEENPDFVAIEDVQYQNNALVYSTLSQLQGMIIGGMIDINIKFHIIKPTVWKSFCGIKGKKRAEQKSNTIQWVYDTYQLKLSEDAADAVGITNCLQSLLVEEI